MKVFDNHRIVKTKVGQTGQVPPSTVHRTSLELELSNGTKIQLELDEEDGVYKAAVSSVVIGNKPVRPRKAVVVA